MATFLLVFLLVSVLTPTLTRLIGLRVFYVVALLPAAAFVHTLTQTGVITAGGAVTQSLPWIPQLGISLSFRVDALAWLLALVVTGVGALVLIYCARYFDEDEPKLGWTRAFARWEMARSTSAWSVLAPDSCRPWSSAA
jgi:multicomponent Na+:H+ antiporter subunit A